MNKNAMDNLFKFKKGKLSPKKTAIKIFWFWVKRREIFFIAVSLTVFGLGLYFSYVSLYKNSWNEERKNRYISSQRQEISFKEKNFTQAIEDIDRKKENYQKDFSPVKDIFKPLEE